MGAMGSMGSMGEEKQGGRIFFYMMAFLKCAAYLTVGPALIVLNKEIMDKKSLNFGYPISLSSLGQIFIAAFTVVVVKLGWVEISEESKDYVFRQGGWKGCLAVGLCKALTLSFGNEVYRHLKMGYIQMLKAFSPVTVQTLLVLTGVETLPSCQTATSLITIAAFTAAITAAESEATALGLLYMFLAQVTEGGALVVTQKLLKHKKFSVMESQYFLAPPSVVALFGLAVVSGEWSRLHADDAYHIMFENKTMFFFAGSLGLVVNYLTSAVIQATSSTMLKVLATMRNLVAVFAGNIRYGEVITLTQWGCYMGSLLGFGSYTYNAMQKQAVRPDSPMERTPAPGTSESKSSRRSMSHKNREHVDSV